MHAGSCVSTTVAISLRNITSNTLFSLQALKQKVPSPMAVQSLAFWGGTAVIGGLWLVQVRWAMGGGLSVPTW